MLTVCLAVPNLAETVRILCASAGFKDAMAAQIGGGGVFTSDKIVIDGIMTARRRMQTRRVLQSSGMEVEWHVEAPEEVMDTVASLVATVRSIPFSMTISWECRA